MFSHLLITRFNIKVSGFGPERMTSQSSAEWLQERLRIFNMYCVPSVISQSNTDFTWLIYFDSDTPIKIINEVSTLKNKISHLKIILVDHFDAFVEDIIRKIRTSPEPYVISSRLDNDDLISSEYINSVQNAFIPVHNTIINFNAGYELSLPDHVLRKWNNSFKNQFTSIIEDKSEPDILTIYGFPHWRPPALSQTINIKTRPMWIYLIHGKNYSEQPGKGIPIFYKSNLTLFPVCIRRYDLSIFNTVRYSVKWLPTIIMRRLKNTFYSGHVKRNI
ncbi:MAG: glycosyltransferase [Saprospiraceae bacterium]